MGRLVMKFGGTSVADIARIRNVARHVEREVKAGHHVAVVVSAKIESGMTGDMKGTAEHRGIVKESPKALAAASTGDEE